MKRFVLFFLDILVLYASLEIALFLRYGSNFLDQNSIHLGPFSFLFAIWVIIYYITNLYSTQTLRNNIQFYSDLFGASLVAAIISVLLFYFVPFLGITPKRNLFIFLIVFSLLEAGMRWLYNSVLEKNFKKSVLIVGINPQSQELADFVQRHPQFGYTLDGLIDISHDAIANIKNKIAQHEIDTIVVSPEAYQMPELIDLLYSLVGQQILFRNLSSFYEYLTGRVPLGAINQIWFLENLTAGRKRLYELAKRLLDVILAVPMSAVFLALSPVFAFFIYMDSPGPIFYRQRRLGRNGKTFEILKLRTMSADAEKGGAVWAQDNDPRVTRLGKFLRKSRMDELPQLWNILRGQMSFVGPRAERPEFHDQLKQAIPFYEERYLIKPGLSGWAQINYRYGSSIADAAEKLQYDLYYIKHRSLILDLGIILRTINISLKQAGR